MSQRTLDQRMLGVGTALTDHTITATDVISFADVGASNAIKRDTVQGVLDLAGGGGLVFISAATTTASDAYVEFDDFSATYDVYKLIAQDLTPDEDNKKLNMQIKVGGSYLAGTNYAWNYDISDSDTQGSNRAAADNTDSKFEVVRALGTGSGEAAWFEMTIYNPLGTSLYKGFSWVGGHLNSNAIYQNCNGGGALWNTGAVQAIKLYTSGTDTSVKGTFRLYGVVKS